MYQPKTPVQYIEMVDQAIFEAEDLLRCAEDEEGGIVEFASQMPVYQELLAELKALRAAVAAGQHAFGVKQVALHALGAPVALAHTLLGSLNTAHKEEF